MGREGSLRWASRSFAGRRRPSSARRWRWAFLLLGVCSTHCTCGGKLRIAAEADGGDPVDASRRPGEPLPDATTRSLDGAVAPARPAEAGTPSDADTIVRPVDAWTATDALPAATDAGQACAARAEATCASAPGCLWLGDDCTPRCTAGRAHECAGSEACDFVQYGPCGVDLVCVPREQLAVRCQAVSPLCGGLERMLCVERHHGDCSDCEACDDVPRLYCAFAPDGTMYVLQGEQYDVLLVDPGWTASGSFFAASTLDEEQESRCDAVRPLPTPPLPCP